MDHFIGFFEAIFPSVKWITNYSLYIHSNWIEFKENCVLLHMIDIVIQLTCIIFDLLSSTKFVQNGIVRIIVVNL